DKRRGGLNAKHRRQARIERAAPAAQGIAIRTIRGDEIAGDRARYGDMAWSFYRAKTSRFGGSWRWLTQKFFSKIFDTMPGPLELVVAERAGRPIAAAFNVHHDDHLFGRYWGCIEEHDHLH